MTGYVIGLDNGGTVCKAALFDLSGREVAVASRQTPLLTPKPGYTERDMDEAFRVNLECLREVLAASSVSPDEVIGLAVAGHGKGLYPWGREGRPAGNGIVSTDNRAWEYPLKWEAEGTSARLYPRLCQRLLACQPAALLAWLKDHDQPTYDRIQWVFSVKDYIRFRLTGEAYAEATDLSGSGLLDLRSVSVERDLLEALGIGEVFEKLPPLRRSAELCGALTAEVAAATGLRAGTPVAGGMFDIDACALAMDITRPEELCTITGTWSINEYLSPAPVTGTAIAMNSLYAIPGAYLIEDCSATSAGNLEWLVSTWFAGEKASLGVEFYPWLAGLVESVRPEDSEVYYLPFLYGSNAHPLAKASFVGLTAYHGRAHQVRAVYEGVAFSHRTHLDRLLTARPAPPAIRMAGGATNSPTWVQMFADVLGYPIETVRGVRELGALGAAMAAAVAAGAFPGFPEAARAMVRVGPAVEPRPEFVAIYEGKYRKYRAVSAALDAVWDQFTV